MEVQMGDEEVDSTLVASSVGSNEPRKIAAAPSEANVMSQLLDMEVDEAASIDEEHVLIRSNDANTTPETDDTLDAVSSVVSEAGYPTQKTATEVQTEPQEERISNNDVTGKAGVDETQAHAMMNAELADLSDTRISNPIDSKSSLESGDISLETAEVEAALQMPSSDRDASQVLPLPPNYPSVIYPPIVTTSDTSITQSTNGVLVDGGRGDGDDDRSDTVGDDAMDDASSEISAGEDLRDDLEAALHGDFDFKGSFYYAATAPTALNPCLNIDGLGHVGLPLSTRDAQAIIECSARAPFGHGERTVIDTKVRDTWEIEPDRVKFDNPAWDNFVQTYVIKTVCDALGVAPSAGAPRCELYKLLLYEPGSHFLEHQDTEKADGMFATVIIVLPSPYTGGEVHVSHSSSKKVIDLAPSSLLSTSVLAWYTDVKHEVKPLTSGYRLALSYNLIQSASGAPRPTLPDMSTAISHLRHVLRKWKKNAYTEGEMEDDIVAFLLEHQYSEANLQAGAKTLKGADAHLIANLRAVAEELGYMVCLANLEYHIHGCADDYGGYRGGYSSDEDDETPGMGEVMETSLKLNNLVDLNGNMLIDQNPLYLSQENLIPKEPFEDESPDDTDYEGYMGNGAGSLDHWYHRTVLVLVHEEDAPKILFSAGGVHYAIQRLKKSNSDVPTPDDSKMAALVLKVLNGNDQATVAFMSDCALKWKDLDMWQTVIKKSGPLMATKFGAEYTIHAWKMFTFQSVRSGFEEMLQNTPRLCDQINFIEGLPRHADPEEYDEIQTWLEEQSARAFASLRSPTIDDIPVLITVGCLKGAVFLLQQILPQLIKNPTIYAFAVAFVKALHEHKGSIPEHPSSTLHSVTDSRPAGKKIFGDLLDQLLNTTVSQWDAVVALPTPVYGAYIYGRYGGAPPVAQEPRVKRILEIVELCLLTGRTAPCHNLFLLLLKMQGSTVDNFQKLYTPLVPRLRDLMRAKGVTLGSSPFSDFLQLLIGSYLRDVLGTRSSRNHNSNIRKVGCGCQDCNAMDSFFSSTKSQETFRLAQARRQHLEGRLHGAGDLVTFVTIRSGSPHGLQVTKRPEIVASQTWEGRVGQAKMFLRSIGDDNAISQLMGNRYGDVLKALTGAQQFALTIGDAAKNLTPMATALSQGTSVPANNTSLGSSSTNLVAPVVAPVAGGKRKRPPMIPAVKLLGFIDLTGDDS